MADNQIGNVGLAFPNGLGVQFSRSQVSGGGAPAPSPEISTVTLTQNGDLIFATPGNSFVDIGETTTGQHVQYINSMAGTTFINSPTMMNGNVVIPHQYNFSMNSENNANVPTATINANLNMNGGTVTVGIGSSVPVNGVIVNAVDVSVAATNTATLAASTIALVGDSSYIQIDDGRPFIDIISQQGGIAFTSGSQIAALATTMTSYSSNSIGFQTSNFSTLARNTFMYSSNQYSNYNGGAVIHADGGIDPARIPNIELISENGTYGHVGIQAKGGLYDLGYGGDVKIEAFGAGNPAFGIGGLVQINAYSAGVGEYGAAVSRVSLNAACITLASGAFAPIPGSPGATNVFGQGLVSIVSATLLPVLPQIPQSVYVFGNSGVRLESGSILGVNQGITMLSDMYAGTIYPIANGSNPLIIRGRSSPSAGVQLMDVESINMVLPNGLITGVSSINSLSFNDPFNIGGVSTINGAAYPPPQGNASLWSYFPQLSSLSTITAATGILSTLNVSSINGQPITQPWYNVPIPFLSTAFNFGGNDLSNVSSLYTSILRTNRISDFSPSGASLSITNLSSVNGSEYVPTQDWALTAAATNIDAAGNNVGNVGTLFANNVNLTNDFTMTNNDSVANFNNNALINVSSLNGFPISAIVNGFVSTATSQLNMSGFDVVNAATVAANSFVGGPSAIDSVSTNAIKCFGNINMVLTNILSTNIIRCVGGAVNTQMDTGGFFGNGVSAVSYVDTPALRNISSINGAPYNAGGWVGTAATNLNMNGFDIAAAKDVTASGTLTCSLVSAASVTTGSVSINGNQAITTVTALNGLVKIQNPNTGTININPDDIFTKKEDIGSLATVEVPVFAGIYLFTNDSVGSQQNMFITINIVAAITQSGRYYFVTANQVYTGSLSQITLQIAGVTKTTLSGLGNNTVVTFDVIQGANGAPGIANLAATAIIS